MTWLAGVRQAQAERQATFTRSLLGMAEPEQGDPEPERTSGGGFDGGARQGQPAPVETHEQWLTRVLASRSADAGRHI